MQVMGERVREAIGGYMSVQICQNLSKHMFKMGVFVKINQNICLKWEAEVEVRDWNSSSV